MTPVAGSATTWFIGQVSQNGPRSAQERRAASLSRMKAPFFVPRRTSVFVAIAASDAAPRLPALLPEALGGRRFDLGGAEVALMRRQRPAMAVGVAQHAVAVAPEHVGNRHDDGGACLDRSREGGVDIADLEVDRHARAAARVGRMA